MRDVDIRPTVRSFLTDKYCGDPDSLLVEELGLCEGAARADLAIVNGVLKGFEIKSERDSLVRLPRQIAAYNMIFDTVSLVSAERHLEGARKLIPLWWGIYVIAPFPSPDGRPRIKRLRREKPNPRIDPYSLVKLLWKDEALELLRRISPSRSFVKRGRDVVWQELAKSLPLHDLRDATRDTLRKRTGWRSDQAQKQDGETSRPASKSLGYPCRILDDRNLRYSHRPN
jgi:hypothetical protein